MKVLAVYALLMGVAFAAPDSDLRRLVDYKGPSSSVSILRGADLDGGNSGERVSYVAPAPRVQYVVRRPVQQVVYRQPAVQQVIYRQPEPATRIVYTRPEPQRIVYTQPAPQQVVYQAPLPAPQPIVYQQRPTDSVEVYGDDDAKYQFAYEVTDEYTRNYQSRQESRDGKSLSGVYSVLDPDGLLRTVRYGDNGHGFVAEVTREPSNLFGGSGYVARGSSDEQ